MASECTNIQVNREAERHYRFEGGGVKQFDNGLSEVVTTFQSTCELAGECALRSTCWPLRGSEGEKEMLIRATDTHPDCPQPDAFKDVIEQFEL
ncbi:MAG: hypothetical protein ACXWLH_04215 [Candidatus Saccharimonadales bacterium]